MRLAPSQPDCSSEPTWSATVLSSHAEILDLERRAPHLFREQSSTFHPSFFLASIAGMAWTPRVVVVTQSGKVAGVMYAKERRLAGFPTGLVYADSTLDGMIASEPGCGEAVFRCGVSTLLTTAGIRGLRISVPRDGFEPAAAHEIAVSLRAGISRSPLENHMVLPLLSSYSDFLDGLRPRTRRNFRYYRRRADAAGIRYEERIALTEFRETAERLLGKSVTGADRDGITRGLAMLSLAGSPLLSGLRAQDGELVSILGGWYEGEQAILFFQMNDDRDHADASLCIVMRGYAIEALIAKGIGSLLIWAGAGHPYSRYCHPIPAVALYLDRRGLLWRGCRLLVQSAGPVLPRRFAWMAAWIVPSPIRTERVRPSDWVRRWVVQREGRWFDVTRHVSTGGFATLDTLTLAGAAQDGFPYLPSRASSARQALRDLPIRNHADYTFVDFGSGKGRALFIASEFPFRKIRGVEFAKELHCEATQNLLRYRYWKQRCRDIESLHMRAEDFSFPNENLVLYFFNPFPAPVLERVLRQLSASLSRNPREVFLVLLFPELAHVVDAVPQLRICEANRRYRIYRTDGT